MNILLPIQAGNLPQGFCFESWQKTLVAFASAMRAVLAGGLAYYNYGDTAPSPENQIYPWLNTNDMRWYRFSGKWITNHEYLPGRHTWEEFENESQIWSFDGGDGSDPSITAPSEQAGAMWMLDLNYAGRSPMSPGDIVGSDPVKTLGYAEDYGSGSLGILEANIPQHSHKMFSPTNENHDIPAAVDTFVQQNGGVSGGNENYAMTASTQAPSNGKTSNFGAETPIKINVVHPVRGMCCIVRTARIYRVAP